MIEGGCASKDNAGPSCVLRYGYDTTSERADKRDFSEDHKDRHEPALGYDCDASRARITL
jgi:hypothetical protein